MNLTVNDPRDLAVAFIDPMTKLAINPATRAAEPFDYTKHLLPMKPVPVDVAAPATGATAIPTALFASLKNADDNDVLVNRPGAQPVFFLVGPDGVPTAVADIWPNNFSLSVPYLTGGFSRSI